MSGRSSEARKIDPASESGLVETLSVEAFVSKAKQNGRLVEGKNNKTKPTLHAARRNKGFAARSCQRKCRVEETGVRFASVQNCSRRQSGSVIPSPT